MIHEIQPGDVVIVTVPASKELDLDERLFESLTDKLRGFNGVSGNVIVRNVPETSVHIIRAKGQAKGEPPKDAWPAWRDRCEVPPTGQKILVSDGRDMWLYKLTEEVTELERWITHWMPLPEGPKP